MNYEDLSPLGKLMKSRKFMVLILDTVVSILLWAVGLFIPQVLEHVTFLIGALQPVAMVIIGAIALEDAAEKINS